MKHSFSSTLAFILMATAGTNLIQATCSYSPQKETKKDDCSPLDKQQFNEICRAIGLEETSLTALRSSDECQKMAVEIAKSFAINMNEHQSKTMNAEVSVDDSTLILMKSLEQISGKYDVELVKKGLALFIMYPESMMQNPEVMECIEKMTRESEPASMN